MCKVFIWLTLFLLVTRHTGLSQILKLNKILKFHSDGQISNAPPTKIRTGDIWNLEIDVDKTKLAEAKNTFKQRVQRIDDILNARTPEENKLVSELVKIDGFFRDNNILNSCKKCLGIDIVTLYEEYPVTDSLKKIELLTFKLNNCIDSLCICKEALLNHNRKLELLSRLYEYSQKRKLMKHLFCELSDSVLNALFVLAPGSDTSRYLRFANQADPYIPPQIDAGHDYIIDNKNFSLDKKTNKFLFKKEINRKVDFSIERRDRFNASILNWHNQTIGLLEKDYINQIDKQVSNDLELVESYKANLSICDPCSERRLRLLETSLKYLKKYDTAWCPTSPISQWLKHWLWYGNGDFKLNYLNFTDPDNFKDNAKLLEERKNEEKNLVELLVKIDSLKKCLPCSVNDLTHFLDTLKVLQDSAAEISKRKIFLTSKNDSLKLKIDENNKAYTEFLSINKLLHSIKLPVQRSSENQEIIYHNVSEDWEIRDKRIYRNKIILPDHYTVHYGFYNATLKDTSFKIQEEQEHFNDSSRFISELNKALTDLASSASAFTPFASPLTQFLKNLIKSPFPASTSESLNTLTNKDTLTNKSTCDLSINEIIYRIWRFELLRQMLRDYKQYPAPQNLQPLKDKTPSFLTFSKKAKEFEAPYTNKYSITANDQPLAAGRYSIGRQKILTVGAGVFFNDKRARQEDVDTVGGGFSVKNEDSKAKFVIGLKVFPFKAFEADGSILPRFPQKRISLFGGFEITDPLRNFYAGIGYDVVPGLQLSAGFHIYRKNYYTIQNNQVTDKTTNYKTSGLYYGFTIDPGVLTGILKTLFN